MTIQANLIYRLSQLSIVFRSMDIMARVASDSVSVHDALDEVVTLHAVFVRSTVREVVETGLAEGAVLEFPEILQI